jgi:hypothetical protein
VCVDPFRHSPVEQEDVLSGGKKILDEAAAGT